MILTIVSRSAENQDQVDLGFNPTAFGFSIVFAVVSFGQLVFVIFHSLSWNRGHGLAKEEPESETLSRCRRIFSILMVLTLIVLILSYSFEAASFTPDFKEVIFARNNISTVLRDIATVPLLASLFVLFFYCRLAAEQWRVRAGASEFATRGPGFNRPGVIFQFVMLFIMIATSICRLVFAAAPQIAVPLATLILYQVYMAAYIAFVVFFAVSAVRAWKKRDISAFHAVDSSNGHVAFDPNEVSVF